MISPSYREMDVEKGAAICHGNVGRGRNGAEQRRPRKSPKPRDPRERGTPPPSESGICRGPFWGQAATGQAVPDDGDKTVTARRLEQPQDLALGRSSLAIPVIKVITDIYYLGPHIPKY